MKAAQANILLGKITSAIDALPEALVLWDEEDRLLVYNNQFRNLCPRVKHLIEPGVQFEHLVREAVRLGQFIIEGDPEDFIARRLEAHRTCQGYFEQHLDTGEWVRISERRAPWGGIVSIRTDLTSLRQRETELRAAKEQADAATAAKSRFLAVISHEMRTPMNSVLGLAQTLAGGSLTHRQQSYLDTIISSARALVGLLDDMLDISRIEQGRLEINTEPVLLRATLDEVVHLFEAQARDKGLQLRARVADNIPEAVLADPLRLRQILINFVNNALKFTDQGYVELSAGLHPGGRLRINVQDTGAGLDSREQAFLFQPFSRIEAPGTKNLEGVGLGLAICKQLATAMGGAVGVNSAKGQGSVFWLELQQAIPVLAAGPDAVPAPVSTPLSVLVVDDDPINGLVARALLEQLGHRATVRRSGKTALSALARKSFDVVLLDILMPGEDGVTVAGRIRQHEGKRGRIPVLACTAKLMPESVEGYKAAGIDGVLPKPLILEQLRAAMDEVAPKPEPALARMRADVGERHFQQIVAQSRQSLDGAQRQVARYAAGGGTKPLSSLLHKLAPTASMLGFAALAREAVSLENALSQRGASRTDTTRLSSLLAAAASQLDAAHRMGQEAAAGHFAPPSARSSRRSVR